MFIPDLSRPFRTYLVFNFFWCQVITVNRVCSHISYCLRPISVGMSFCFSFKIFFGLGGSLSMINSFSSFRHMFVGIHFVASINHVIDFLTLSLRPCCLLSSVVLCNWPVSYSSCEGLAFHAFYFVQRGSLQATGKHFSSELSSE